MQQVGAGVGYLGRVQATLQPDLTPSSGRPPVSPKASVMGSARRRRPVSPHRRSFGLKFGFIVFAGLSGALAFSVLTDGGRHIRAMAPFFPEVDEVLYWTGLRIDQVTVSGQRFTPDADVFDALDLLNVRSLLSIDPQAAAVLRFPLKLPLWAAPEGDVLFRRTGAPLGSSLASSSSQGYRAHLHSVS